MVREATEHALVTPPALVTYPQLPDGGRPDESQQGSFAGAGLGGELKFARSRDPRFAAPLTKRSRRRFALSSAATLATGPAANAPAPFEG
jgi:hypothetical protein